MEGHRGEPRNKPPFPGVYGLWGKPTLMNSVETFAHVPVILERGAEWWNEQGTNGVTGLKFFAVSGHVEQPGRVLRADGHHRRATCSSSAGGMRDGASSAPSSPGGASSNFLGPDRLDVPLDFEPLAEAGSMLGSGALVVDRRGHRPAGGRHQRAALLPQRVVRQVRALPGRIDQGARDPHELLAAGGGARTWTTGSRARGDACG